MSICLHAKQHAVNSQSIIIPLYEEEGVRTPICTIVEDLLLKTLRLITDSMHIKAGFHIES
jgi:hypothetical protein